MLFLISAIDTSIYSEDLEPSRYLLYRSSNEWYHYLFNSLQRGKPLYRCAFAFREYIIMLLSKQSKQKSKKNVKGTWSQNSCDNLHHHHCHHIWAIILPQTKARFDDHHVGRRATFLLGNSIEKGPRWLDLLQNQ